MDEKLARWFNTSAFVSSQTGRDGNAGSSIIPGPGSWNWEGRCRKRFASQNLEFRWDAFNNRDGVGAA